MRILLQCIDTNSGGGGGFGDQQAPGEHQRASTRERHACRETGSSPLRPSKCGGCRALSKLALAKYGRRFKCIKLNFERTWGPKGSIIL